MYTKRGNVKITKIVSDLRDASRFVNLRVLSFSLKNCGLFVLKQIHYEVNQ